jgi:U3 small nucleolar RNA-associated protein 6
MAEIIQGILEDMIPDLLDLQTREIFTEEEIKEIINTRRSLEYKLMRNIPEKKYFYSAIKYELDLEDQRKEKKEELNLKPAGSDRSIIRRIISLFKRFSRVFKHDVEVWKEFINFCIRSKSLRDLSQVMAQALQLHSTNQNLWIIARHVEEKVRNDIDSARAILQRAVLVNRKNIKLWTEYFEFELEHSKDSEAPVIVFKYAVQELPHIAKTLLKLAKLNKIPTNSFKEIKEITKLLKITS